MDHYKMRKTLKQMGVPEHLTCILRKLYACTEATFRNYLRCECFKFGKGYDKVVYSHPAYLSSVQSTEMLGWMNHKLESRLLGEILTTSDNADDTERVTGRKARGFQMEDMGCKCQIFFISLFSGRRKQG